MEGLDNDGSAERRWSGYSDYEEVAKRLHDDINRAVSAYSHLDSMHQQNMGVPPRTAVKARSAILGISRRVFVEIKRNRNIDGFEEMHARWAGLEEEDGEWVGADDPGFIERLERADFTRESPGWLGSLIDDLVEAGWELGYLKAGREEVADPTDDDAQVREMFE